MQLAECDTCHLDSFQDPQVGVLGLWEWAYTTTCQGCQEEAKINEPLYCYCGTIYFIIISQIWTLCPFCMTLWLGVGTGMFCLPDSILLGFGDAVAEGRCLVVDVGVGVVNGVVGVGSGIERLQLGPCSSNAITFSAQAVRIFTS